VGDSPCPPGGGGLIFRGFFGVDGGLNGGSSVRRHGSGASGNIYQILAGEALVKRLEPIDDSPMKTLAKASKQTNNF
jgi:hypothetical protein